MKLKKGDQIIVIAGKDKGRKGKISAVFSGQNAVLVPEINMYKRHTKKKDEKHPGGIITSARPIDISKIMMMCPSCGKPTRIGWIVSKDTKVRICKKCHQKI